MNLYINDTSLPQNILLSQTFLMLNYIVAAIDRLVHIAFSPRNYMNQLTIDLRSEPLFNTFYNRA